jgi:hypothetical protein
MINFDCSRIMQAIECGRRQCVLRCLYQSKELVMTLDFNSQGFLHRTIALSYEEFRFHFGTNPRRIEQIDNASRYFYIFSLCGCTSVYIDGSFISKKEHPEDIDLCFDLTDVDPKKLERLFPQFFNLNQMGKIRRDFLCHIFHFSVSDMSLFELLQYDRDDNFKGFVELNLKDLHSFYDQE